jgi:hypothetical protein
MNSDYQDDKSIADSDSVLAPLRASFTSDIDLNAYMVQRDGKSVNLSHNTLNTSEMSH